MPGQSPPTHRRDRWVRRPWIVAGTVVLALGTGGCSWVERGALRPAGPGADHLQDIFYISLVVATVVSVVTLGLLGYALWRRRSEDEEERPPWGSGTKFVAIMGLGMPVVVLLGMMVVTFVYLAGMDTTGTMTIHVTGHQWWWEVYYPDADTTTANEIHIPTGVDVEVRLQTNDVIHSFWVPELGGKQDLVPGRINDVVIRADEPGIYRGQCAEYCGLQHALMAYLVVAHEPAEFEDWLAHEALPALPDDPEGLLVFERHACASCHTIRGTTANGELGPDLTHLASRLELGAGTIVNTRGHLAGWVVNSQTIKPGNLMPPILTLEPDELETLLDYLESLE